MNRFRKAAVGEGRQNTAYTRADLQFRDRHTRRSSIVGKVGSQHRLRADEGIPVGDDREVDGVQARHRDRENLAAIEGEKNQLPKVVQGVRIQNGIDVVEMPAHHAA
jgi:hypothetical protein